MTDPTISYPMRFVEFQGERYVRVSDMMHALRESGRVAAAEGLSAQLTTIALRNALSEAAATVKLGWGR